jgi:hypothetical protein
MFCNFEVLILYIHSKTLRLSAVIRSVTVTLKQGHVQELVRFVHTCSVTCEFRSITLCSSTAAVTAGWFVGWITLSFFRVARSLQ